MPSLWACSVVPGNRTVTHHGLLPGTSTLCRAFPGTFCVEQVECLADTI